MSDQEKDNYLGKKIFDGNSQGESRGCVWDKHAPELYLCFCP